MEAKVFPRITQECFRHSNPMYVQTNEGKTDAQRLANPQGLISNQLHHETLRLQTTQEHIQRFEYRNELKSSDNIELC